MHVPVAMSCSWGKGEIILVSTPLLFTNYGVLDGKNAAYIFRLLSQIGEFPIIRTEGYLEEAAQVQILLSAILFLNDRFAGLCI